MGERSIHGVLVVVALSFLPRDAFAEEGPATLEVCGLEVAANATTLEVSDRSCERGDFAVLGRLKGLEQLTLARCGVTDADLAALSSLPHLEKLAVRDSELTNVGLRHVAELDGLHELDLRGNEKLTGAGLGRLVELPRLERLWLAPGQVTDIGLAHLSKMKHLDVLGSGASPGCEETEGCFDLRGGELTARGLARLKSLPVKHLLISGRDLDDRALAVASRIPTLESLNCANIEIGGRRNAPGCFNLSTSEAITPAGLRHLRGRRVRYLFALEGADGGPLVRAAAAIPTLEVLNCRTCLSDPYEGGCADDEDPCERWQVTERCVDLGSNEVAARDLEPLRKMSVEHLRLMPRCIDGAVLHLAASLPGIETLNCRPGEQGCVNLEGAAVVGADLPVLAAFPDLAELRLPENIEIVPPAADFLAGRASLQRVSAGQPADLGIDGFCAGPSTLDLRGAKVGDRALALLAKSKNVRQLCLGGGAITDASVPLIATFEDLRQLDVQGTGITAKGLRALLGVTTLETLRAPPSSVTDAVIAHVAQHPALRRLNHDREVCVSQCEEGSMYFCRIGGCGLNYDEGCVQKARSYCSSGCADDEGALWIGLDETALTPAGYRKLASIPKRLRLRLHRPGDVAVAPISALKNLDSLNCHSHACVNLGRSTAPAHVEPGELSPAAVRHLVKAAHLRTVLLPDELSGDDALEVLVTMPNLRSFNQQVDFDVSEGFDLLSAKGLTPRGVELLGKAKRLRSLMLPNKLIDDAVLSVLSGFAHLRAVNCGPHRPAGPATPGCVDLRGSRVTAEGLGALKGFGRRLGTVLLEKSLVTDPTLDLLSKLPSLGSVNCEAEVPEVRPSRPEPCVDLRGSGVTEEGLAALRGLEGATKFLIPPELVTDRSLTRLVSQVKVDSLNCESWGRPSHSVYYDATWLVPSCFDLEDAAVTVGGLKRLKKLRPMIVILPEGIPPAKVERYLPDTTLHVEPPGELYENYY